MAREGAYACTMREAHTQAARLPNQPTRLALVNPHVSPRQRPTPFHRLSTASHILGFVPKNQRAAEPRYSATRVLPNSSVHSNAAWQGLHRSTCWPWCLPVADRSTMPQNPVQTWRESETQNRPAASIIRLYGSLSAAQYHHIVRIVDELHSSLATCTFQPRTNVPNDFVSPSSLLALCTVSIAKRSG